MLTGDTGANTNMGALVTPDYPDYLVEDPKNQPLLRRLMRVRTTTSDTVIVDREVTEYFLLTDATEAELAGSLTMTVRNPNGIGTAAPFNSARIVHQSSPTQSLNVASISGNVVTFDAAVTAAIEVGDRLELDDFIVTPQASFAPKSEDEWEDYSVTVEDVVTLARASVQGLADVNRGRDIIDNRLLSRAARAEDRMFLYGPGGAGQIEGLFTSGAISQVLWSTAPTGSTKIDFIIQNIYVLALRNFVPTAIVLHPTDHRDVALTKGTDGHYIFMQVQTEGAPMQMFAIPLLWSNQLEVGHGLVADFQSLGVIHDREDAQLTIGTAGNDFAEALRTIRAPERAASGIEHHPPFVPNALGRAT